MKFLFVNLEWNGLVSHKNFKIHLSLPPLDLILLNNIATASGHEAKIFDCFVTDPHTLANEVARVDWVVVTTSPYHMWQCPNAEWDTVRESLSIFPKEKTVLIGLHGSVFPEQTLRQTGVRAVIRREPETVLKQFLGCLDWTQCQSVAYLKSEAYHENPLSVLPSMDDLVVTDYTVDTSKYSYFLLGKNCGVFESSRGCPWKCTFCDQEMYSWKYRTKSPEIFADEVLRSIEQTGMKNAYFYDLEFTIIGKRTLEICSALIKRGIQKKIRWACQTRADMVNEENLTALRDAGCVLIHFGVESANREILKATNKKITLDKIERGVKLAKKMGFQTACFFMFGLPEEKSTEFDTTLEFARSLNPTYASFHFAIPFPGTPLYDRYIKEKQLAWGAWPAYYFDGWSSEKISAYVRRAYRKFYLVPRRFEVQQFLFRLGNLPEKLAYFRSI